MSDTIAESNTFKEVNTAAEWKAQAGHAATMPSGTVVRLRVPNLAQLATTGELPNDLVKSAIPEIAGPEPEPLTVEEALVVIKKLADFQTWITTVSVTYPPITPEDVPSLPTEDLEMIVALATRQRDMDAIGHHLGSLEKSADFRRFRGLTDGDEDLLG